MKNLSLLISWMLLVINLSAQVRYSARDNVSMTVSGTSTMHDWDMKSSSGSCDATFILDDNGNITGLTRMNFKTPAKSLKSGKDGMDKNAYKALKVDANPEITAVLKNAEVIAKGSNYTINSRIDLTIAGKTLETDLVVTAKQDGDKIVVSGEKKIDMKQYDVTPPSFMLGTVKTGKDVTLKFNLTLTR
jgi:hypothetical protein